MVWGDEGEERGGMSERVKGRGEMGGRVERWEEREGARLKINEYRWNISH